MGYALMLGACVGCKQIFSFNPHKVPSVMVNGQREPLCERCVARFNPIRAAHGLEPIEPLAGAYEPFDEMEL